MLARPLICVYICLEDFTSWSSSQIFVWKLKVPSRATYYSLKIKSNIGIYILRCWLSCLNVQSKLKGLMLLCAAREPYGHTEELTT